MDARGVQTRYDVIWNLTPNFIFSTLRFFYIKMATSERGISYIPLAWLVIFHSIWKEIKIYFSERIAASKCHAVIGWKVARSNSQPIKAFIATQRKRFLDTSYWMPQLLNGTKYSIFVYIYSRIRLYIFAYMYIYIHTICSEIYK